MSWNEPASSLSQYWPVLSAAAIKSAGLLSLAVIAACAMRRASAAMRHWVWLLALCGTLMLPIFSVALPQWKVLPTQMVLQSEPIFLPAPTFVTAPLDLPAAPEASVLSPPPITPVDWASWAMLAWAIGAVLLFAPILLGMICLWRLGARAKPAGNGGWNSLLNELSAKLNLSRHVRLLQSDRRSMPMTWGIWRAIILLPIEADAWPIQRKRLVLAHELAHVKRGDGLTQILAQLTRAMYWFNPLVWVGVRRLAVERERACDDIVLSQGAKASDYAEELLTVATGYRPARIAGMAAFAMARPSTLEGRMRAILDSCRNRRSSTRRMVGIGLIVLMVTLLPLAALRSRAAADAGASTDEQIARLIKEARQDIDTNDYTAALGVLDQILALDAKNEYANGVREFVTDRAILQDQRRARELFAAAPATQPALSPADQEVQAALDKILPETNFDGTSFADVIDYLRDTTGANIFVNKRALETAGVDPTTPITLKLHNVKFSKALSVILELAGGEKLRFNVDNGVITISTAAQLNMNVTTQVYDVADLVCSPGNPQPNQGFLDQLVILIQDTVANNSWKVNGGTIGAISEISSKAQLVITQTPRNQQGIASLLSMVRYKNELNFARGVIWQRGTRILVRPPDNDRWKATLLNGVVVELLGVSESPSKDRAWWRPDDSPLGQRPYNQPLGITVYPAADEKAREFAIRLTNRPAGEISTVWEFPAGAAKIVSGSSTVMDGGRPIENLLATAVSLPADRLLITLDFGIAAGSWETLVEDSNPTGSSEQNSADASVAFAPISESNGNVSATVTHDEIGNETRLLAIGIDGHEYTGSRSYSNGGSHFVQMTTIFPHVRIADIKSILLQKREYQWVEFKDVMLQPKYVATPGRNP